MLVIGIEIHFTGNIAAYGAFFSNPAFVSCHTLCRAKFYIAHATFLKVCNIGVSIRAAGVTAQFAMGFETLVGVLENLATSSTMGSPRK